MGGRFQLALRPGARACQAGYRHNARKMELMAAEGEGATRASGAQAFYL